MKVTLFAAEPDIVAPIGTAFDARGRLMVIESHSHFRPKNYEGPPTDRVRVLEDTDNDGRADKFTTFFEGTNLLMNLATDKDGSVVVSSRNEIFRLTDKDGDGVADQRTTLAKLDTKADYPHNGLGGLTIGPDGQVYFGIGENFGGAYVLSGTDGSKFADDTTFAGNVFRIDPHGKGLVRFARGFA